jgi:hypothetical protein
MIESAAEIARRLQRDARRGVATRYWAGWRLSLTYGPYEDSLDTANVQFARETAEQILGEKFDPKDAALHRAVQQGLWHLSASWRGGYPANDGRTRLDELVGAIGVPEEHRAGSQPIRVFGPGGQSPQVTHWVWRDLRVEAQTA